MIDQEEILADIDRAFEALDTLMALLMRGRIDGAITPETWDRLVIKLETQCKNLTVPIGLARLLRSETVRSEYRRAIREEDP